MEETPSGSTFTSDSRKQSYLMHKLLWEDAEEYTLYKGPKIKVKKDRKHAKSRPQAFTYVLVNILGSALGNIWRFPAAAYLHGGGTFLLAYFVILIFVAKPVFYLEVAMGQFTGKGSGKWWCVCPALRGIAVGQLIASVAVVSYYGVISSYALLYFIQSFNIKIPWVVCKDVKNMTTCFNSNVTTPLNKTGTLFPFSDLFFREHFMKEVSKFADYIPISMPDTGLLLYLFIVWIFVGVLLYNGVKSTGSYAYFGATLPYIILIILTIKTVSLPGAYKGINYLFTADMEALDNPTIWYMAAIQAFFTLNASIGVASFLSSERNFRHRLNRYVCLTTLLDVILLLLASSVVFATLGTLSHVTGKSIDKTPYLGGIELTTVIYSDALAKASANPEGLSVFFLLMLTIVGIGSTAVVMQSIMSTVWDLMPRVTAKIMAPLFTVFGFALGCIYLTPAGLAILQLADHYVAGGIMCHMALYEVAAIAYIYGLQKYCKDMSYMTRRKIHVYWRVCLGITVPCILIKILIDYGVSSSWQITYRGEKYPEMVLFICFGLQFLGEVMIILWFLIALSSFCIGRIRKKPKQFAIVPNSSYGPADDYLTRDWKRFIQGLKRCTWKEQKSLKSKVLYPLKVVLGILHDDVFR